MVNWHHVYHIVMAILITATIVWCVTLLLIYNGNIGIHIPTYPNYSNGSLVITNP
jgi:hypothetical protein